VAVRRGELAAHVGSVPGSARSSGVRQRAMNSWPGMLLGVSAQRSPVRQRPPVIRIDGVSTARPRSSSSRPPRR
jgi:hypothetical protein